MLVFMITENCEFVPKLRSSSFLILLSVGQSIQESLKELLWNTCVLSVFFWGLALKIIEQRSYRNKNVLLGIRRSFSYEYLPLNPNYSDPVQASTSNAQIHYLRVCNLKNYCQSSLSGNLYETQ